MNVADGPPPRHRRRRHRRHHRHRRRRVPSRPRRQLRRRAVPQLHDGHPGHRRAVRGRRPASTRPTSTRAATAPTWPASSPPPATASARPAWPPTPRSSTCGPGQDSGYFFLYETVAALTYAADAGLDVVNMSFYTDPWLYNCDSADDYVSGTGHRGRAGRAGAAPSRPSPPRSSTPTTPGVTLVAAAGNGHTDLSLPTRSDASSPDYPAAAPRSTRTVTNDCLDLPSEGPHVIAVSSVGPSGTKSDFSNYGLGSIDVAAPGGWFRDFFGTPQFSTPGNMVLSSYPLQTRHRRGPGRRRRRTPRRLQPAGAATAGARTAASTPTCRARRWRRRTSPASPPWSSRSTAGAAPAAATRWPPTRCGPASSSPPPTPPAPPAGVEDYTDEGRPADWNAACAGSTADNGLYGEGIVNAAAAVGARTRLTPA